MKGIKITRLHPFFSGATFLLIILLNLFRANVVDGQSRRRPAKKAASVKQVEKPLPELKLPDLNGAQWSLHENRGRIVLLNFWATWCAPCRVETPMLINLGKEYKTRGLEIVGIALDDDGAGNIKKFAADFKINYPILLPVPGSRLAQIDPVPTTLLIDSQGRFYKKYVGAMPDKILRADIEKLMKSSAVGTKTPAVNKIKNKSAL